jgi:Uma2 family endonuclease
MSIAIEMEDEIEDAVEVEPQRRRFTVEEFQRMGEAGIIAPDERVELIDGEVYEMTPVGPRHILAIIQLTRYFIKLLEDEFLVSPQSPVRIGEVEPFPDIALLKPGPDYRERLPQPEDCVLIVEVSDSSVGFDLHVKSRIYAAFSIPEYWVVDLTRNCVVVHQSPDGGPDGGNYRQVTEYLRGESFRSSALREREIPVSDLLG